MDKHQKRMKGKKNIDLSENDAQRMQKYHWPGNVRELKNFIRQSIVYGEWDWQKLNQSEAMFGTHGDVDPGQAPD